MNDKTSNGNDAAAATSAWEPLKIPMFRSLWIAYTASNIGTWVQDVGGAWYMTSITDSPVYVALMQTATSLPLFLLAVPAGVASDLYDRKRILTWTLIWIITSAMTLGLMILFGLKSPTLLLLLTGMFNLGGAFFVPSWQATIPEMVPKSQLTGAIAINSASLNVARAVGPAIGGLMLATLGAWSTYFLNALITTAVLILVIRWQRSPQSQKLPPEHFLAAVRIGLRYVKNSSVLKTLLFRTLMFIIPASALFAMLPIVVKKELGLSAAGYGILLGFVGAGALFGVYLLPKVRTRFSINVITMIASIALGLVLFLLSILEFLPLIASLMLLAGLAWLLSLSSFHVTTMSSVPAWVRGRAVAIYLLIFYGGMSGGAALWGYLTSIYGTGYSLITAGTLLLLGTAAAVRFKLPVMDSLNLEPAARWPEPTVTREFDPNDHAVMITVEYFIDPKQHQYFKNAMYALKEIRQRDGAFSWVLTEDVSDASRYIEVFYLESWLEHLHQHQRGTGEDEHVEKLAKGFHVKTQPVKVSHLIISHQKGD